MNTMNRIGYALGICALFTLVGCEAVNGPGSTANSGSATSGPVNSGGAYSGYGVVQAIELLQQNTTANSGIGGSGIGIGAIAGAVVGGVLGNQVGGGSGQTIATVAGAAGGAYVGNEIENRQGQKKTADAYKVTVRMDSGSYQTVTQDNAAGLRVGDRVRIENGLVQRY